MPARLAAALATAFKTLVTHCRRCNQPYDAADAADVAYHTQPGGCR